MSHIVKINVFMICIFIVFKLVFFTTVNFDLHFKYKRFDQLNDLVSILYRISPAIFFTLAVQLFKFVFASHF